MRSTGSSGRRGRWYATGPARWGYVGRSGSRCRFRRWSGHRDSLPPFRMAHCPQGRFIMGGGLDDISTRRALKWPALLTLITLAIGAAISLQTGVSGWRVFAPYLGAWAASTLLSILIWIFVRVAILLPERADDPLQTVLRRISEPSRLALLPAIIFPIFLGAYTWAKCSIPFAVGYGWENVWANADRFIFGED